MAMTNTQRETIERALSVVAENAARRITAGQDRRSAIRGAVAEFSERWPKLGAVVADIVLSEEAA